MLTCWSWDFFRDQHSRRNYFDPITLNSFGGLSVSSSMPPYPRELPPGWLAGRRSRAGAGACHGSPLLQKHAPAQHCPAPYSKSLLLCFLAARDSCSQQPPCLEHWDKEMYNCIVILHDSAEKTRVKQQPPQNNQNCILTIHLCMLLWLCVILWFRKNKTDTEEEETRREIYFYLL